MPGHVEPAPDGPTPDGQAADGPGPDGATAPPRRRLVLLGAVAGSVVALDQATKAWALVALDDGPVDLWWGARLALTFNSRGAFGLGGDAVPFLALGALVLVLAMTLRGDTTTRLGPALSLGLVLGGAVGNLADRVFRAPGRLRGAVVDFVDLGWWPVFNLADTAITVGCVVLIVAGWRAADEDT